MKKTYFLHGCINVDISAHYTSGTHFLGLVGHIVAKTSSIVW